MSEISSNWPCSRRGPQPGGELPSQVTAPLARAFFCARQAVVIASARLSLDECAVCATREDFSCRRVAIHLMLILGNISYKPPIGMGCESFARLPKPGQRRAFAHGRLVGRRVRVPAGRTKGMWRSQGTKRPSQSSQRKLRALGLSATTQGPHAEPWARSRHGRTQSAPKVIRPLGFDQERYPCRSGVRGVTPSTS